MDKRNRPALGFLLVGISAAGRALLAVPEGVSTAELSLTMLAVVGYLVLARQGWRQLVCGVGQLILELILCGSQTQAGGVWSWLAPLLRAADLALLLAASLLMLALAEERGKALPVILAATWAVYAVTALLPAMQTASAAAFVAFSAALLWYTVLMIRRYNALRVRK